MQALPGAFSPKTAPARTTAWDISTSQTLMSRWRPDKDPIPGLKHPHTGPSSRHKVHLAGIERDRPAVGRHKQPHAGVDASTDAAPIGPPNRTTK